ncbi:PaaI family thioesterase [Kribbella deserti]|uniref:Medium/long-chain acyl-CoA thioesterase YigI n=1 Tax=Kribbella deserti TaxID=1926257 RepID=A0ABV6QJK7_9ACTN
MELTLDDAREVLAAQPFSVLLGAKVTAFGNSAATLEIDVRPELLQQNGYLHGGVLAYAADNAITFAAGTTLGPSVLTTGVTINYLAPGAGITLRAEAEVAHTGSRQATCVCRLSMLAGDGSVTLSALAQGTVRTVKP